MTDGDGEDKVLQIGMEETGGGKEGVGGRGSASGGGGGILQEMAWLRGWEGAMRGAARHILRPLVLPVLSYFYASNIFPRRYHSPRGLHLAAAACLRPAKRGSVWSGVAEGAGVRAGDAAPLARGL